MYFVYLQIELLPSIPIFTKSTILTCSQIYILALKTNKKEKQFKEPYKKANELFKICITHLTFSVSMGKIN